MFPFLLVTISWKDLFSWEANSSLNSLADLEKPLLLSLHHATYTLYIVPVLHLLNVKQLVTDYGMAYDPAEQLPPGESAVYFTTEYPRLPAAVGLLGAAAILLAVKFWPVKEELG